MAAFYQVQPLMRALLRVVPSWGGELNMERVLKAMEEACEMGVRNIHLTGG